MPQTMHSTPVVLKFGGELLEDPQRAVALAQAIARLHRTLPLVIVHGGGREIDAALARAGIEKRQIDGLRITDEPTLDVVVGVLAGLVNTRFVAALGAAGVRAVGLTGADAGIGIVQAAPPHRATTGAIVDLGRVGDPVGKDTPSLLVDLCRKGYLPVVSSIGASRDGRLFNVNADTLAAHLAARLKSPRLVIAGATAGVFDNQGGTIPQMSFADIDTLVASGGATAGMVAKLAACRLALDRGARDVFVADGRDLAGLMVIARHGLKAGAGKCTRISIGQTAKRRQARKKAS
ncbi:MAG: acetylglutamate kinase [Vicinamibacterales bacterium]|nr:acetylglutamate kinase [Vicinamibacterales bacterium]